MAMSLTDMKRLLARARTKPVNVAICTGEQPGTALLLMDREKQPKAVLKLLAGQFPDGKEPRWGTAQVDIDTDPKLVTFRLNRTGGTLARKIVKTLKGTGFSKVAIVSSRTPPPKER